MIESKFTFHSVGQGLFYSGIINSRPHEDSFVFVYDCGSTNSKEYLNREIDEFKELLDKTNNKTIDLLVISHFHRDHINGIPYLLKDQNIKVNTVIFQDLSEMQKLENYIYYRYQTDNYDKELSSLILDPIKFFSEKVDGEIMLLSNDDGNTKLGDDSNIERNSSEGINIGKSSIRIDRKYIVNQDNKKIYTKNNIKCESKVWEFCFLRDEQINEEIHHKINEYLTRNHYKIKDLISDDDKVEELIKELKECKPKLKFNESSMILVHYPLHIFNDYEVHSVNNNQFSVYCGKYDCNQCCKFCQRYFYHNCCDCCCRLFTHYYRKSPATILTGDVVLNNDNYKIIEQFVNNKISVIFQVPHHGAKENSAKFIDFIEQNSNICSIIPCGYMYNQPSDFVCGNLTKPYIVDLRNMYSYIIIKN